MSVRSSGLRFPAPSAIGVLAGLMVAGFAPTFYLRSWFHSPALSPLLVVHGAAFSAWLVLLILQSALVRMDRLRWHRRLGVLGAAMAAVLVPLGIAVALSGAAEGTAAARAGLPPLAFVIIPLGQALIFGALVFAAILWRHDRDAHVRLMLLATLNLIAPAIARIIANATGVLAPPAVGAVLLILIVACAIHDRATRGCVHPVFAWIGPLTVLSFPLRMLVGHTEGWLRFAAWLVQHRPAP